MLLHKLNRFYRMAGLPFLLLLLAACGGGGGGDGSPAIPQLTVSNPSVMEGDAGTSDLVFTVNLSAAASATVTVDYTTADNSATLADNDYTGIATTMLTIPAGDTQATIIVTVNNDNNVETDEVLHLNLSNISSNATLATNTASGTIINDDFPIVSISPTEVVEGDSGITNMIFTVSMDVQAIGDVTMRYDSSDVSATAGVDYTFASATLVIPQNDLSTTIIVPVNGDITPEADETLNLSLSDLSSNARFAIDSAFGTIRTDELPAVSISPASIDEGNSGQRQLIFDVTLNAPTLGSTTINYETSDIGSAVANDDYAQTSGTVTIDQGNTQASITVDVNGDIDPESDEIFQITLTGVTGNAELNATAEMAIGTIRDDDNAIGSGEAKVTVRSAFVSEGVDGEQRTIVFNVDVAPTDNNAPITFDYATEEILSSAGATAGIDYVEVPVTTLTIPAGDSSTTITVTINGDDNEENDELFNLLLSNVSSNATLVTPIVSGLIIDDDGANAGQPRVSISHASVLEGDVEGSQTTTDMVFNVTLTEPVPTDVTVEFATRELVFPAPSAVAGTDFITTNSSVTFLPNETTATIVVPIIREDVVENDEIFYVDLTNITTGNAALGNSVAQATIVTDEPFTFVSITNEGLSEGADTEMKVMTFTINLSVASTEEVTLDYQTIDGTAEVADNDYLAVPLTTLTIPTGDTQATINVTITGDDVNEIDEQFTVLLSNISQNAEFTDAIGTGSIANDDNTAGWGLPQLLNPQQTVDNEALPRIVMNDNGDAMVVWYRPGSFFLPLDEQFNPSSRYTPGAGWGPVEVPQGLVNTSKRDFSLSLDGSGNAFLFRSTGGLITNLHTPGSGWSEARNQEDDLQAAYPGLGSFWQYLQIASNNQGEAMLVGTVTNSSFGNTVFNRYDPVNGWETTDLLAPLNEGYINTQLAMDDNGNAIIIWGSSEARRYDVSTGRWSDPVPITEEAIPGFGIYEGMNSPQLAMDPNGNAIAVWRDDDTNIVANRYDVQLGDWTGPVILDEIDLLNNPESEHPRVAMDANGNAFVIWLENTATSGFEYSIRARRYDVVNEWEDEKTVADPLLVYRRIDVGSETLLNGVDVPDLAIDDTGRALVVWSQDVDGDGIHTIRASRYDGTDWGAPEPISDDTMGDASQAQIAEDASGNGIAVWQQLDPLNSQLKVWVNRFVAP